ncbi:hypothetical protein HK28_10965 [Acetobacter sp. DsW_063]|nr:hypothetical protein HK28_10965 [Acetobacter sp. DsW_063]
MAGGLHVIWPWLGRLSFDSRTILAPLDGLIIGQAIEDAHPVAPAHNHPTMGWLQIAERKARKSLADWRSPWLTFLREASVWLHMMSSLVDSPRFWFATLVEEDIHYRVRDDEARSADLDGKNFAFLDQTVGSLPGKATEVMDMAHVNERRNPIIFQHHGIQRYRATGMVRGVMDFPKDHCPNGFGDNELPSE